MMTGLLFEEVRELLRTKVCLDDSGIPVWGSESVVLGRVNPDDVLVLPGKMTIDSYERAVSTITEADRLGVHHYKRCGALIDNDSREIVLPPVVEVFNTDNVLTFGYDMFALLAAQRLQNTTIPVIMVRRTCMVQVPNKDIEEPWPGSPRKYVSLKNWKERDNGGRRFFVFNY